MTQPMQEPAANAGDVPQSPAVQPPAAAAPSDLPVTIGAHFKMIFLVIVGFTVMFWLAHFSLLIFPSNPEAPEMQDALETTKIAGFSGLGTIFGLLGGAVTGKV